MTARTRLTAPIWRRYRRTPAALEALSDRDLRDVGFGRDEFGRVARHAAERR